MSASPRQFAAYIGRLFRGFERHQRRQVLAYFVLLPALIAGIILLSHFYTSQRERLIEERRLLTWLVSLPTYDQKTIDAVLKVKEASLAAVVIESAQQESIVIDRVYPKGEGEVSCSVSTVLFDQFIGWVERFNREHPYINLSYVSISRTSADNPQQVTVNFTLAL